MRGFSRVWIRAIVSDTRDGIKGEFSGWRIKRQVRVNIQSNGYDTHMCD